MKIALAQINSTDDVEQNLTSIEKLIQESAVSFEKPEIIFFPENSLFFRLNTADKVKALRLDDPCFKKLENLATTTGIALHLTTALQDESHSVFNASVLIEPGNLAVITYRKIHLFDIELTGQKPVRESDCFAPGLNENIFEFKGFKFGSSICYDVRFSELYARYAKQQVDVILIPAAFLVKTGQVHWDVLVRARAIESQCFVLAPAQVGKHVGKDEKFFRETYGHSLVVDPWGQVVAQKPAAVGLVYADIHHDQIRSVRSQIPMSRHRRL